MKKIELAFTALLLPLDFVVVFCAALSAYGLRYNWLMDFRPFVITIPFNDYMWLAVAWAGVFILCYAMAGLYAVRSARKLKYELSRIMLASSAAAMVSIVLVFFRGELFASRFIVLAAWLFSMLAVAILHIFVRVIQRGLLHAGIGTRRVVMIGGGDSTSDFLIEEFSRNPGYGYSIVATFRSFTASAKQKIAALRSSKMLEEIIVTTPKMSRDELGDLLNFAESRQLVLSYAADLVSTYGRNIDIGVIAGIPLVTIKATRLEGWGYIYKRLFDLIGSFLLIVLTSPIMLLTAIAIKLESRGPVFFSRIDDGKGPRVVRVGKNGKPFAFVKFRSMYPGRHLERYKQLAHMDASKGGPLVKLPSEDPRITRVGAFIRRYSIDELPQLFLVLFGKMSLVGPRPHYPEEVAKYEDYQLRVLAVKPGITGLAQVSGRRDLTFEDEVRLDTYYIENWSIWLDIAILFKTPFVVFRKKGAY